VLPEWLEFDPDWYLLAYPEAREEISAGQARDAADHYRTRGRERGWNPNARFSEEFYLGHYPDVAEAVRNGAHAGGFEHFARAGYAEGRRPNGLWIHEAWYRERYPDEAAAVDGGRCRTPYEHYLREGAALGRDPHPAFAEDWYRRRYPDVAALVAAGRYLCAYQHFLERGREEGRQPHPRFDAARYRELNPDLDAAIRAGQVADAYLHLVTLGLEEGRQWKKDGDAQRLRKAATAIARCRLEAFFAGGDTLVFEPPESPEVSVLLVLYNRAELTLQCLESLRRSRGVELEIIVVDNRSEDRTRELLDRIEGARILRNDDNVGFTRATNQAAAAARGDYLLLLNNDTEVFPASIRAALDRLRATPDAGAVGGRVIGLDGRLQEAGSIVWRDGSTEGYGRGDDPHSGAYLFPREVDYCSGVFLLTRRSTFEELGGLDLAFTPAYYEESDYCFRLRRRGLRVLYEPYAALLHFGSASLPDESHVNRMLARNRPVFLERHRDELATAWEPDVAHLFPASTRQRFRGRVLLLDDHVPLERLGGGSPRLQEILHALAELGYFVTFFATNPIPTDRRAIHRELPETNLEIIDHLGRPGFADFWRGRRDFYDWLIVSRPHNFRELLASGFEPACERARVVYDAEAVVARRRELQLAVLGEAPAESHMTLAEEIALARAAPEVWAVSAAEGEVLASPSQRLTIVAHAAKGEPGQRPFAERRGILFVGRLDEEWNPNVDALRWFLEQVHPRMAERLGAFEMSVVGEPGVADLPRPAGVRFLGRVEDLAPIYDRHRIFVAPTRFAAGIPHKVTGAATHGLPVVATSLLARQLGWRHGVEIMDGGDGDPERFAAQAVELYTDGETWHAIRANALLRVEREHSRKALKEALRRALSTGSGSDGRPR